MNIPVSHLPAFSKALQEALQSDKLWLGFDERIEQLSVYDLHFFELGRHVQEFQAFNQQQDKDVTILPTEALLGYLQDTARELLKDGKQFSHIEFDDLKVLEYYSDLLFNRDYAKAEQLMDEHDWSKVVYDPDTNVGALSTEEQITFNRLEYLIEKIAALAQSGERGMEAARALAERHWKGTAWEQSTADILQGKYVFANRETLANDAPSLADTRLDREPLIHHKNNDMNAENLDYLQNQLKFLGFGEGLNAQLEQRLKEGMPDFQLQASHTFGKDQMEAVLYFKKSEKEGKEMYFFNKYDATLTKDERSMKQTFYINNKGQSITFKESCNLLNGRAVFKELAPKEGEKYKAWVKLDFSERDDKGNAKAKHFHENFGYDVKEALGRVPLKELSDPDKFQSLVASIEKGNLATVTLLKDGAEKQVQVTADPQFKTLKMYDMEGKKLYVPAEKQDQRYGQAPVDEKRVGNGFEQSVGEELGKGKTNLLPVNDVGQGQGMKQSF